MNTKSKKQIRKSRNIVEILMTAIEENALLDVIIHPANLRTNAFFVCQDGNMGKRDSLIMTTLNSEEEVTALRESSRITIFLQTVRFLVEFEGKFITLIDVKGTPCVKMNFPSVISVSPQAREFRRLRIPFSVNLPLKAVTKNQKSFDAKVFDIALGGCSFIRHLDENSKSQVALTKGVMLKVSLFSPDRTNPYEIPVTGVARKIFTMRNRYNEVVELVGFEFNLVSTSGRGDFEKLLRFIDGEFARTRNQTNPVIDKCILEQESLEDNYPDVHQAIDSANPDVMLSMLTIWRQDINARRALVSAIVKAGLSRAGLASCLVSALKTLAEIEWFPEADVLVDAIIERRHVVSLLKVLDLIPAKSPSLERLVHVIAMDGSPEKLLEAVKLCVKNVRVQQNILPVLISTGTAKQLIEAYKYLDKDSPLLPGLLENILERTKSTVDLMPLIELATDVDSLTFQKLIQRFIKGAPVNELVKLLESRVDDYTKIGEYLVTEIVIRGKTEQMLEAMDHMKMDSFGSVGLAFALARFGRPHQIAAALSKTSTLPRAGIILRYASMRKASEERSKGFSLTRILNLDSNPDKGQGDMAQVQMQAKRMMGEAEDRLCDLSVEIHGAVMGRLRRH